jgi:hypothetical protein
VENTLQVFVYRGDADELIINAEHDPSLPETTLSWESIHQPLVPDGYDVVTGAFSTAGAGVGGAACLGTRVAQELPAPGSPVTKTDTGADPTLFCSVTKTTACTVDADCPGVETCSTPEVFFYIAGYAHTTSICSGDPPVQFCVVDADCPGAETCIEGETTLLGRDSDDTLRAELHICPP